DGDRGAGPGERRLHGELINGLAQAFAGVRGSGRRQGQEGGESEQECRGSPPGPEALLFCSKQINLARARSPACSIVAAACPAGNAPESRDAALCTSLDDRTGGGTVPFPVASGFAALAGAASQSRRVRGRGRGHTGGKGLGLRYPRRPL